MGSTIWDLGDDLLITQIPRYLSPEDIFNFSLVNKATYNAFHHSSLTTALYKILYNKKFTNNDQNYTIDNADDLNWVQLFKLRVSLAQKVYTWGSSAMGRLGYLTRSIDQTHLTSNPWGMKHVHTPTNLLPFNGHLIVDVIANGFSFLILTNAGDIFYTGMSWKRSADNTPESTPGPIGGKDAGPPASEMALTSLATVPPLSSRRSIRGGVVALPFTSQRTHRSEADPPQPTGPPQSRRRLQPNPNLTLPPEEMQLPRELNNSAEPPKAGAIEENNLLTKLKLPELPGDERKRKIISLSSGREHIVALDNLNYIYTWDTGSYHNEGTRLHFPGIDPTASVLKISAGWNLSGCYIAEVGIVIWYTRNAITPEQYASGNKVSEAKYVVIPHTKHRVTDFAVGLDYVLYIEKKSKKLFKFKLSAGEYAQRTDPVPFDELSTSISEMDNFNQGIKDFNTKEGIFSAFSQIKCCFTNFAVITDDGNVFIGNKSHLEYTSTHDEDHEGYRPKWISELQNKDIKAVEMGDHHYVALTGDGKILSWGLEIDGCGSLGLGDKESILAKYDSSEIAEQGRGRGFRALKPLQAQNPPYPGKWVAITANGWHTGGIYVPT